MPRWLQRSGRGWMTAEYSLLPASTGERTEREASRGKQGGRTIEIQRLIGRALRAVVRLRGARRADALARLRRAPGRRRHPLRRDLAAPTWPRAARSTVSASRRRSPGSVAAVSVGIVDGRAAARSRLLRGLAGGDRHERRHDRRRAHSSRCRRRQSASRSRATLLDELLDLAARRDRARSRRRRTRRSPPSVPDLSTGRGARCACCSRPALGGAIGLERELRDHEAGFRTHLIVCARRLRVHARLGVRVDGLDVLDELGVVFDPTRIAAQIVTGIGFLGAGAIIVRGINVRGPDDGGDALGRGRDRDGRRHRLLRGRCRRGACSCSSRSGRSSSSARVSCRACARRRQRSRSTSRRTGKARRVLDADRGARRRRSSRSSSARSATLDVVAARFAARGVGAGWPRGWPSSTDVERRAVAP